MILKFALDSNILLYSISNQNFIRERLQLSHNRLKTAYRNSLKTETLNDLLRISIKGDTLKGFEPTAATDKYFSTERKGYTNIMR